MSFEKLNLIQPLKTALSGEGYTIPTPIQSQAIPVILERRDLIGCAQTGTGKTAAFALPILQILSGERESSKSKRIIKSLILTPTRELALQISESFKVYGKHTGLKNAVVFGGVSQRTQTQKLREGVDILISLLTKEESHTLNLEQEKNIAKMYGVKMINYPIPDRGSLPNTPGSIAFVDALADKIKQGWTVVIHCWGGIGRSGMLASSILVRLGYTPYGAVTLVSKSRGQMVPETELQVRTILKMEEQLNMNLKEVFRKALLTERYLDKPPITQDQQNRGWDYANKVMESSQLNPDEIFTIYELEYKLFRIGQIKQKEGWLPDRLDMKFEKGKRQLNELLKRQIEKLHKVFIGWAIGEEAEFIVDETVGWYELEKRATKQYLDTHPGASAMPDRSDPEYAKILEKIVDDYFEEVWNNREPYKTVEQTIQKLKTPSSGLSENIHLFNRGLMTAHNNGKMLEKALGKAKTGTKPETKRYRGYGFFYSKRFLDDLSNGKFVKQWDDELPKIDPSLFSLKKSPSMTLKNALDLEEEKFPTPEELVRFIGN